MLTKCSNVLLLGFLVCISTAANAQGWKTDVGFTQLSNELGAGVATGIGVDAMFVEVETSGNYMPDVASSNLLSKTFIYGSGPSGISGHANAVCNYFFGISSSISPDVGEDPLFPITGHGANDWVNFGLGFATAQDPNLQPYHVSNHSYIATLGGDFTEAVAVNLLERLDFAINQTEMTTLVGSSNSTNGQLPALWVHGYNCISVGVTDGSHAASETAPTYLYGNGRIKPEIVAPAGATSYSTPMIATAASLLHESGAGTDAVRSETMKAILLAGATKEEFGEWTRTPTQPLDLRYGAGELNVYNSYFIQAGGEFDGENGLPGFSVGLNGWDYEPQITVGSERVYELEVPEDTILDDLSAILTWNMEITDVDPSSSFLPIQSLADMELTLFDSDSGFQNQVLDFSDSSVDNIEHIYQQTLLPGTYHLRVTSDMDMDFGFAWRSQSRSAPSLNALGRKLLDGFADGGTLADTAASDDQVYAIAPSPTSNPYKQKVDLILISVADVTSPGKLGFRIEAAMVGGPEGDVLEELKLFNFNNLTWESVSVGTATNADSIVKFVEVDDPTRFVNSQNGEMRARLTWQSPAFAGTPFTWSIDIDHVAWQSVD